MSTNMDLWSTLDSVMHRLFCDKQEEDSWVGFYQYFVFCQHFQFYMKGTIIKSFLTDHQFYQQFFLQSFPLRAPMFVGQVSWIVWAAVSWCVPHQEECAARPSTLSNGQTAHTCSGQFYFVQTGGKYDSVTEMCMHAGWLNDFQLGQLHNVAA